MLAYIQVMHYLCNVEREQQCNWQAEKTCYKTHKIIAVFIACINKRLYLYSVDNVDDEWKLFDVLNIKFVVNVI